MTLYLEYELFNALERFLHGEALVGLGKGEDINGFPAYCFTV